MDQTSKPSMTHLNNRSYRVTYFNLFNNSFEMGQHDMNYFNSFYVNELN